MSAKRLWVATCDYEKHPMTTHESSTAMLDGNLRKDEMHATLLRCGWVRTSHAKLACASCVAVHGLKDYIVLREVNA